jgi:nucleoid DNA-binding protein
MNKTQLIEAVAADSGLSKADSTRAIESFVATVGKTL